MENEKNGNLPIDENLVSRTENVAGQDVEVFYDKEDTDFENPVSAVSPNTLEGDALETWKKKAENVIRMTKTADDKYKDAAEIRREVAELREEIKRDREAFDKEKKAFELSRTTKAPSAPERPNFLKMLSKITGEPIKSLDDAAEYKVDDPRGYEKAKLRYEEARDDFMLSRTKDPVAAVENSLLRKQIGDDGQNYSQVEAWSSARGWKVDQNSYAAFLNTQPKKDKEIDRINKHSKRSDFIWINEGRRPANVVGDKSLSDMFDTREELEKYISTELDKESPDPRVVEFMKKS